MMKRNLLKKNSVRILLMLLACVMVFAACGNQGDKEQGTTNSSQASQPSVGGADKDYALKVGDEVLTKEVFDFFVTLEAKSTLDSGMVKSLDEEVNGKKASELIKMGVVDGFKAPLAVVSYLKKEGFKPNEADLDARFKTLKEETSEETLKFYSDLGFSDEMFFKVLKEQLLFTAYEEEFVKRQKTLIRDSMEFKNMLSSQIVQVKARHILVEDEETAKKVIESYNSKEKTFSELATEFSKDPGSAAEGGDLGYFGRGMMVPGFEAAAFALEVGAISEPVQTQYGYHIILCEDKRTISQMQSSGAEQLEVERETNRLLNSLIGEPIQQEVKRIQKGLVIDVNTEYIDSFVIQIKAMTEPK